MPYSFINVGTFVTGFDATLTPSIPSGVSAGNLLLLHAGLMRGTPGAVPSVSGWTLLSPSTYSSSVMATVLYGRISTGSDTASITWDIENDSGAVIAAYSGNPASLTGIVNASNSYLAGNNNNGANFEALSIKTAGSLVVAGAFTNCTNSTSGATWNSFGSFAIRAQAQLLTTGGGFNAVYNDWIQTLATSVTEGEQTTTIASSSNQNYATYIVSLSPLGTSGSGSILGVGAPWI